ncbi:uncharacterized protein GGS22DRAFT_146568 [Annulohypoxylon maeteangense]|uniref:uncharacterized protein n=1 Tax=Annulohypoxylon maeteangense TaxID=1927788 RepID=UPI0020082170|nr:uncharacterized protein GGS22DRAFT_146568 [Annulohypoxylon maeteangense]KAI0884749.1 hypothetical protein GGS22DRAFT_146568 [Annulohypoxylon maeteangense]
MEEATKTIETLVKNILPFKAHYLSLDTTRRYREQTDDKRLEEQVIRPLQYTTFISDAERGILLTRAYFDVREEPVNPANATDTPTPKKTDPNKPKTKLSLKDYKNKKKSPDGEEPPKPPAQPTKANAPAKKLPDPVVNDMDDHRDGRRGLPDMKASLKAEARRHRSPSPERKKRFAEVDQDSKPAKRSRVENATPNSVSSRTIKDHTPQKSERLISSEKKLTKDSKTLPMTNGRSALASTAHKGISPKPGAHINGTQKLSKNRDMTDKKTESNSNSKAPYVPPLLSPIDMSDYIDDDPKTTRPIPKKKPADSNNLKLPPKKSREDRDPSPSPKKRKIPPLLSPTLPPIVLEELARTNKSTPSKDIKESSQRSSQFSDSPNGQKKAAKPSKREETIHVDSNKGQRDSLIVTLKYKKRNAKTVERLLALPPVGKKKSDLLKKEERMARDRSDSLEPGTARKRPIPAIDASEAIKRPKTSENTRPTTPPRQSSAMTRVASNSSQAGTPGVTNGFTPAAQPPERRRPPIDPEKLQRLQSRSTNIIQIAIKLKHERDAVLKRQTDGIAERDRQVAIAAGIQCLVSFLFGFKLQSDAAEIERKPGSIRSLRELLALFRVTRTDCARHNALTALILRLQGICLVHIGRVVWSYPHDQEFANLMLTNSKDQQETWRQADSARRAMGIYDGGSKSDDGGSIGKLIDRLGPWTTPEEAIPITLEVLRKVMQSNSSWKPVDALTRIGHSSTNGTTTSI